MKQTTLNKKLFLIFLIAFFLLSTQISVFAKDEWTIIQSENFKMIGNAKEKDLQNVALKLEQFRYVFTQLFPKLNFNSPIPTNVIVFKSEKSFRHFKPIEDGKRTDWVAGYFQPGEDVNHIVLSTEGEKEQTYRTIFHEYTHFLINNNLGKSNVPPWVNEGYAEYFEQMIIEKDKKVTLGGLNDNHLRLLYRTKMIPLETFFEIDYYSLNRQTSDGVGVFYAQSWALMHYLWHSKDEERRGQMTEFLNMILNGNAPKVSFEKAFKTDYKTMEKELEKYVKQRTFNTMVYTSKSDLEIETKMEIAPLDDAEANAYQGNLLYHSNRFDDAAVYLDEAIKLNPKSSLANTTLGLVKMKQKNFVEAKTYLEKALLLDPNNYSVHYSYAYILSREAMNNDGYVSSFDSESDEKMRKSLRRAIQLNPNFTESYNLYAFISVVQNTELDEAIEMLRKALAISPGNQWYQIRISELYLRKQEFENARKIAQSVFKSAPDNQLRSYAENTLKNIDSFKERVESMKSQNGSTRTMMIQTDKPLTEKEKVALLEKMMNKSVNEALRKPKGEEKRLTGFITKIECKQKGIFFTLKNGDKIIELTSETFQNLHLAAFNVNLDGRQFGCDAAFPNDLAVISYVPNKDQKSKVLGEIVAIEMVPKSFRFETDETEIIQ